MNPLNKPELLPPSEVPSTRAVSGRAAASDLVARNHYLSSSSYPPNAAAEESDGGLVEYWRILARHKRTIFLSSLAGLLIGFAVGIPMKPVYRASSTIEVLTLNGDFMNMKQANPTTTNDFNFDTSEEQTQAKLLQSSALINRVIDKLDPTGASTRSVQHKPQMATAGWRSWLHLAEPARSSPQQTLLSAAAMSLKVRPTARTRVIEVSADSSNPEIAAAFANTLTQEFIAQNMESRWATIQHTSEWLKRELDDTRDKLRKSEDALQDYASKSGLIFTDENTNVATEKLQQLQQNLSAATADRIAKQSRYELAQNAKPDSLGDVLSDPSLREIQAKINDLKRQIADLTAVYSPEYSKVRRLQAELESLQPVSDRQHADILERIKNDYVEANRKEGLLTSAFKVQTHEVAGQDEKAIQYNILKRDVDSNRQLYDTMLQQMKQASIASAMRASNVRVVDAAEVPTSSFSPNFKLNSALGLFAGFFASIALVTIKERADRAVRQPGDIKQWTEIAELGTIPSATMAAKGALYYRPFATLESPTDLKVPKGITVAEPVELVTWQQNPSMIAEAFRSTLTSVLFMTDANNRPRVLVFTSANAGDGKTTVVSNLAIAAAEIRMKVLVIDADLRRPRMHTIFNLDNDRGLSDLLRGEAEEGELDQLIQETRVDHLSLLPAGTATHAAAHLLYSPMWAALLGRLRTQYDMIFVDTPPMLQMTDARVAARLADAVVLVGRSGGTTRDALLAAKERLEEDRIPVLGAILNGWDPKNSPGGYYGQHRGEYYKTNSYSYK